MNIVFWAMIIAGTIGAIENTKKLNALCKKEVEEGVSETVKECKQYYYDTRIKKDGSKMSRLVERARALQRARDRAQNPEFKKLWNDKLIKLLSPPA